MRINSAAYRILTLSNAGGFLFTAARSVTSSMTGSHSTPLAYQVAMLGSSALIPIFLLWRNFQTLRLRQEMITTELSSASPWYYKLTVVAVWLTLAFQFGLPAVGLFVAYASPDNSVATSLLLDNVSVAGLWLQSPTVFFMELQCAYHCQNPNNALQATHEDARA